MIQMLLGVLLVFGGGLLGAAAASVDVPAGGATNAFHSVFVSDPKFGVDPFFPKSTRRDIVPVEPDTSPVAMPTDLVLKGVSVLPNRRLAIINNYTFEEGEVGEVKIENNSFKLRCVEVRERSAVISINGMTRELFLRPGI